MKLTLEQYESVQQYLDDKMTTEEENQFINEVNSNILMKEYLQFELEMRQNLELINRKKNVSGNDTSEKEFDDARYIQSLIEKAANEWQEENKTKTSISLAATSGIPEKKSAVVISLPFWFSIAAAGCLLFFVAGVLWFMANKTGPQSIAGNNNAGATGKKNNVIAETSVTEVKDSLKIIQPAKPSLNFAALYKKFYKKDNAPKQKPTLLGEALTDYENADYKTLENFNLTDLPTSRGISQNNLNSDQNVKELGHYYKGLAFMQSNKDKQAFDNLQWVVDSASNKQLIIKAKWYQALIYIKKGNDNNAIPLLAFVADNKAASFTTKAKELLQLLGQ